MSALRRYEILLPRQFNDGRSVPDALIGQAVVELRSRFGAASCEIQIIQGFWHQGGELYRDNLIRLFVDVADTEESREFFRDFKEQLKERFQQLEIYVTSHPIEVL
ncbi:hypothetical protein LBMAG56_42810 [Verrucomicrobiota bacterium]|nr:hypothetical protein LBMAG56_42810 [Verrucomicrobiota bacterium]